MNDELEFDYEPEYFQRTSDKNSINRDYSIPIHGEFCLKTIDNNPLVDRSDLATYHRKFYNR